MDSQPAGGSSISVVPFDTHLFDRDDLITLKDQMAHPKRS